jgi:ATP-dependent helicase HrpB
VSAGPIGPRDPGHGTSRRGGSGDGGSGDGRAVPRLLGPPLPIDEALPALAAALRTGNAAVLVAPPGAGKTTRVPLALLDEPWLAGRKIIVSEPRRLAARAAARRMAATLGEAVGETVGIRARLGTLVGPRTRIEVVTEGVLTRMLLDDPELTGVGALLLDELHERSLDADLALALARDAQTGLREDLRLLPMSATLDGARVAALLGDCPVIASEGRAFPVETRYAGRAPGRRLEDALAEVITGALAREAGSILVFLPGQAEIRRLEAMLAERLRGSAAGAAVDVVPLYGAMEQKAQDRAIEPAPAGRRKVVLATSIAETSLTIEGVRVVVDSGLARVPRYEPDVGVTRLETVRVSRAAADQRRGRAGRTEPGVCYRLWEEAETRALAPFAEPEIRSADLAGLVLDCAAWGETDPTRLAWLDPPPRPALEAARADLEAIGALEPGGALSETGRRLRALPLPPRLAHMLLTAARSGEAREAALLAAVLVERGLGGNDTDLAGRLAAFRRDRGPRAGEMRRLAEGWAETARRSCAAGSNGSGPRPERGSLGPGEGTARLLALAWPDRIAKARGAPGHFVLANGRGGVLEATEALARAPFLVVAELTGKAANARIVLAAASDAEEVEAIAADRVRLGTEISLDPAVGELRARRVRRLGAIVLSSEPLPVEPGPEAANILARAAARHGIARLGWSKAQAQLRDRVRFVREAEAATGGGSTLPDLTDDALAHSVEAWLAPHLHAATRLADIDAELLALALDTLLPYAARRHLDEAAPTHWTAPSGNRHAVDYDGSGAPRVSLRVQELFGLDRHPAIAGGRLALTLELLSPAHRPIQITRDLPGFWRGSWHAVKSEMRGRYPRHPWPDDPASATPTTRAKPRT